MITYILLEGVEGVLIRLFFAMITAMIVPAPKGGKGKKSTPVFFTLPGFMGPIAVVYYMLFPALGAVSLAFAIGFFLPENFKFFVQVLNYFNPPPEEAKNKKKG